MSDNEEMCKMDYGEWQGQWPGWEYFEGWKDQDEESDKGTCILCNKQFVIRRWMKRKNGKGKVRQLWNHTAKKHLQRRHRITFEKREDCNPSHKCPFCNAMIKKDGLCVSDHFKFHF